MEAESGVVEGLAVLKSDGSVLYSTGLAGDQRVRSLMADKAWMASARHHRLQSLTLDRRSYSVLVTPMRGAELIVFSALTGQAVLEFLGSVDFAYDILEHLLTDPFDAMTVVDGEARVAYVSPVHERFFGLSRGEANGRPVREVIENTRLDKIVATGLPEVGEIQHMRGSERVVSRVPIRRDGRIVGAVGRVMFKGPQQVEALARRVNALENEVRFYKREAAALRTRSYGLDELIGESPAMQRLKSELTKIAPLSIPVLIHGESGTGKELVAHALHRLSPRRDATHVMVNAAALPATLVESELFGYEPGAFTGADRKGRKGKFEQAAGGTIFLDEIGDMPMEVQAKLLRVLQDHMVERIGGDRPYQVDFRLVTATNRNLQDLVGQGQFRLDLYYRISPISIEVPPLRRRIDDIPQLVAHFLKEVAGRHGYPVPEVEESALAYLMEQAWPGNIRQLRHEVERAFVFAENGRISADTFVGHSDSFVPPVVPPEERGLLPRRGESLKSNLGRVEAELVREALVRHKGNKKRVAEELGISRSYLYKLLDEGMRL
ncbi:sigma-54 interaction domain-containing protein [Aquabacter spiritensis]|uniref:PAS domain S-box-containing protein n=1 Tax=Aquabacter spiritensis TaxID=933073 RepID=A0A4R3M1Z6_9HYPH|nr:sigma 54-interacting transcriptional regulator [Aquabacter spiritensis]TCT06219.1 PAS domain S-box-containing protein [Aquabacter spiritensis]